MNNITINALKEIMVCDLNLLRQEILAYTHEEDLWKIKGEIKNSAGNLCLHLCGNLQHFIGAILGKSGYVRNREAEFSKKNIPAPELLKEIDTTITAIDRTFNLLKESDLQKNYPLEVFGKPMTAIFFLIHLTAHFNYHLGQINYHRRLVY